MKAKKLFLYILTIGFLITGCRPDAFKEIGDAVKPVESITGQWKLRKVTQSDINAVEKGFPYKTLDITDVLPYQDVTFSLAFSNGAPGSFATGNASGLDLFDFENGTWGVDDINAPSVIYLINNNDSATLTIGSYPNSVNHNTLIISVIKKDEETNKELIRYDYEFVH
ncbi:DUF5004 domain-containing protein [Gynurincola endophyticus]|jgi:hypothetical protein|uniref:DUF5004 domain-containing protein n=1 Tax=Gynurincola endophyticus TaxID=2479004 RepID=UPI000F8E9FF1|nr:DUF5004 domain-containing protein [Gynurincola endophyticus]